MATHGVPGFSDIVYMPPPLSVTGFSLGSGFGWSPVAAKPHELPESMMWPSEDRTLLHSVVSVVGSDTIVFFTSGALAPVPVTTTPFLDPPVFHEMVSLKNESATVALSTTPPEVRPPVAVLLFPVTVTFVRASGRTPVCTRPAPPLVPPAVFAWSRPSWYVSPPLRYIPPPSDPAELFSMVIWASSPQDVAQSPYTPPPFAEAVLSRM